MYWLIQSDPILGFSLPAASLAHVRVRVRVLLTNFSLSLKSTKREVPAGLNRPCLSLPQIRLTHA